MIFADCNEYETAKSQLKEQLKSQVTNAFEKISEQCWFGIYDLWGNVLENTRPEFLRFTKGHKREWCDKMSLLFETAFDSVVKVVHKTTKTINIETLHVFIDDFFDDDNELFFEDWFFCSKCLRAVPALDEEKKPFVCWDCADSTTLK